MKIEGVIGEYRDQMPEAQFDVDIKFRGFGVERSRDQC